MRAHVVRAAASLGLIGAVTLAVAALQPVAPDISLGALYALAVLAAAVWWGLAYAVAVSVVSLLVFNWFFLPPVHTFALEDSGNWTALVVYLVTAIVTSELASRSRRRAAEAERRERDAALLADLAARLLEQGRPRRARAAGRAGEGILRRVGCSRRSRRSSLSLRSVNGSRVKRSTRKR